MLLSLHSRPNLYLTTDEMARLDRTYLNALLDTGVLQENDDVETVICDECEQRCRVGVERVYDTSGRLVRAYVFCDERDDIVPKIAVDLSRLREWRSVTMNLAQFLAQQLDTKNRPIETVVGRFWQLGPVRYAGQRADVFLAVAAAAQDFPAIWTSVATAVNQCSAPVLLMPGDIPVSLTVDPGVRALSLTRILGLEGDRLILDVDEILRCAGIAASLAADHDFIHSDDYTSVRLNNQPYSLTTNQSLVIHALHQAYEHKTYWLTKDYLLETVLDTISDRLLDTFKSNKVAWQNLIVKDRRGRYRLNLPMV